MHRLFAAALALACLAPFATPRAHACGNTFVSLYLLPVATRRVEQVESLLAAGDTRAAYRAAHEVASAVVGAQAIDRRGHALDAGEWAEMLAEEELGDHTVELHTRHPDRAAAIERRAKLLRAILVVRLDGQIARDGRAARRVHPTVRLEQLARAKADLESLVEEGAEDPRLAAYLAEADVRLDPTRAASARDTLRELAARDLIGDPLTWVALADLETEASARDAALERCRTMVTGRADGVCVAS